MQPEVGHHDQPLAANLRAVLVLLTESGDITPMGRRIIESILDHHTARTHAE